jgi:DNA polymerase-1
MPVKRAPSCSLNHPHSLQREGTDAELVLFVHDEVVVHCPAEQVESVVAAVHESAATAGRLLFGATTVRFALDVSVVGTYADAK